MRRAYRLVAAVGLGLVGGAAAGPQPPATPPPAPPASPSPSGPWANKFFLPDIADRPDQAPPPAITHDFGEVPHGTVCSHTFTLTNPYDAPMQVTDVRMSCLCLNVEKFTQVLQPFDSADFTVTMNTAKFVGANTQTLYVKFGPKHVSTAVLKLSATSRTDVQVSPGAVAFGAVAQGVRAAQGVKVEYKGSMRGWKLTEVVPPAGPIDVEVKETGRGGPIRGGADYLVTVALKPSAPPGPVSERVFVKTNDKDNPLVQLTVTGQVVAPLSVDPSPVRLAAAVGGSPATARVLVRAARPFRVLKVDGAGEGVSVEVPPPGREGLPVLAIQAVTVRFAPKQAGAVTRELRLKTDLDGGAVAVIPVEADGR
ncbi:MAG: DUF1573 domain-containing protein [Gemmataceae bacterium]|nr:DUF1573 domain-containing protein [Gemmataceae bacterium]